MAESNPPISRPAYHIPRVVIKHSELISRSELPAWAGLIEATVQTGREDWYGRVIPDRIVLSEVVKDPQLHQVKVTGDRLTDVFRTGYYRYRHQIWESIKDKSS